MLLQTSNNKLTNYDSWHAYEKKIENSVIRQIVYNIKVMIDHCMALSFTTSEISYVE